MKNNTRVTIKDVAKMAGVTPQTVSRALRNAPEIADSTRKRVLEIAEQLNYVRNSTACAFRGGKTKIIAVVVIIHPTSILVQDSLTTKVVP